MFPKTYRVRCFRAACGHAADEVDYHNSRGIFLKSYSPGGFFAIEPLHGPALESGEFTYRRHVVALLRAAATPEGRDRVLLDYWDRVAKLTAPKRRPVFHLMAVERGLQPARKSYFARFDACGAY